MKTSQSNLNKEKEQFVAYLEQNGLRKTRERLAIFDCILSVNGHFTTDDLHQKLEDKKFHVSKSTLYYTIEILLNAGLIVGHQFNSLAVLYETKKRAMNHHHVICTSCGAVKEVARDTVSMEYAKKITKFTQEYSLIYIYGLCSRCKFRQLQEKKQKKQ